jgi:hypothetical protein
MYDEQIPHRYKERKPVNNLEKVKLTRIQDKPLVHIAFQFV